MKRRTLLATAGAVTAGAPSFAAGQSGTDGEPDCSGESIAVAKRGNETVETRSVPTAWYDRVETARELQDEFREEYGDEPWFETTGRGSGPNEICGMGAPKVTVYVNDADAARAALPDERDGVPIHVDANPPDPPESGGDVARGETAVPERDEANETPQQTDRTDETPGMGPLGAVLGLGGAIGLLGHRRDGDRKS